MKSPLRAGQRIFSPQGLMSVSSRAISAGGGAFSPTDITGLVAWFDFSDIDTLWQDTSGTSAVTTDGQAIARIDDKSGNANHATNGTGGAQPTYDTDVSFATGAAAAFGGSQHLATAGFAGGDVEVPKTIVVVGKLGVTTGTQQFTDGTDSGNRGIIYVTSSNWHIYNGSVANSGDAADDGPHILTAILNGASSFLYLDGTEIFSGSAGTHGLAGLKIGARYDGANSLQATAHVCEVLVYSAGLSAGDRGDLEDYLNTKWEIHGFTPEIVSFSPETATSGDPMIDLNIATNYMPAGWTLNDVRLNSTSADMVTRLNHYQIQATWNTNPGVGSYTINVDYNSGSTVSSGTTFEVTA